MLSISFCVLAYIREFTSAGPGEIYHGYLSLLQIIPGYTKKNVRMFQMFGSSLKPGIGITTVNLISKSLYVYTLFKLNKVYPLYKLTYPRNDMGSNLILLVLTRMIAKPTHPRIDIGDTAANMSGSDEI